MDDFSILLQFNPIIFNHAIQTWQKYLFSMFSYKTILHRFGFACYVASSLQVCYPSNQCNFGYRNYWRDYDTALFILKLLYRDIPKDPNSTEASHGEDMKDVSDSIGLSDQRETIEEELPLTFSDKSVVRNFSSRANKLLKKH